MVRFLCDYLRLSVTDRCNLNCSYCGDGRTIRPAGGHDRLSADEIDRMAASLIPLGIKRVRLTGGEPLLRGDICRIVSRLRARPELTDIAMTTNGLLFSGMAAELKTAGLKRVNISLDTLKEERYASLTGVDGLTAALGAVHRALEIGLSPVKVNVVLLKGVNDDEILDFARLTLKEPIDVRFIEYMGAGKGGVELRHVPYNDVLYQLKENFKLSEKPYDGVGGGPARYVKLDGAKGFVGFISPNSENFCASCSRLRLSSDGRLYPCLFSKNYIDLRQLMNIGEVADIAGLKAGFRRESVDMCYFGG
jgi:cyclic pyranopterin phosphate synthase